MPVGKIETGILKPGMTLMFSPAKLTAEVKSIEMHHQGLETALPGHNVGFNIKNVAVKNLRRGDVAGNAQQDPPSDVSSFEAQVVRFSSTKFKIITYSSLCADVTFFFPVR